MHLRSPRFLIKRSKGCVAISNPYNYRHINYNLLKSFSLVKTTPQLSKLVSGVPAILNQCILAST